MITALVDMYTSYSTFLEENVDARIKHFPLVSSPIPMMIIVFVYAKFVYNWGPAYMKDKQPFQLKRAMIIYNALQVLTNATVVYLAVTKVWLHESYDWVCEPNNFSETEPHLSIAQLAYSYYILKLLDLTDTVFMVLRKKDRQISFLHTYHHMAMCFAGWVGSGFIGGGAHTVLFGTLNCVVHTIMYSYYLVAALKPEYTSSFIKRRITELQLTQFTIFFAHEVYILLTPTCPFPTWALVLVTPQDVFMFVLFWDFYIKTYLQPQKKTAPTKKD